MSFKFLWIVTILVPIALCAGAPARASLIADGVTYTLLETTLSPTQDQFTLEITGSNGPSDTEGSRYGVNSLAFTQPTPGSVVTGSMAGFTFMTGADLKIQWVGGNPGKYDLVSQTLTPTVVPLPAALPLLLSGLAGLGFMSRRKAA